MNRYSLINQNPQPLAQHDSPNSWVECLCTCAHVHVIGHQVPPQSCSRSALPTYAHDPKVLAHRLKYRLLTPFLDKYHVTLAIPACMRQALLLIHPTLLFP